MLAQGVDLTSPGSTRTTPFHESESESEILNDEHPGLDLALTHRGMEAGLPRVSKFKLPFHWQGFLMILMPGLTSALHKTCFPPNTIFCSSTIAESWLAPPDYVISWKKYKQATVFSPIPL